MNNKYLIHARFQSAFSGLFCIDIEAIKTAEMTSLSRQTINKIYGSLRVRIATLCLSERVLSSGEFELDESYFGARRIRGIRGRGVKGKTIVFGVLKRSGNVTTFVVNDCSEHSLIPLIQKVIMPGSTIFTDGFKTYKTLRKYGYTNHFCVNHESNEFVRNRLIHTNGIEEFWGLCKASLAKFRGLNKTTFKRHILECEFRYNHRDEKLYLLLLRELRKNPLKLS